MNWKKLPAHVRRQINTAMMKTWAQGDRLTYADLVQHGQVHVTFDPDPLAAWLDERPQRWGQYRCVADANRAFKRDRR